MADSQTSENPVELFDMHVAHVGINAQNPEEAHEIAQQFKLLLGLDVHETEVSYFSDTLVETMKQNGRGEKGHIGFAVNDITAAEAWFEKRGMPVDNASRRLAADGSTMLVYFQKDIAGFAIHLTQA